MQKLKAYYIITQEISFNNENIITKVVDIIYVKHWGFKPQRLQYFAKKVFVEIEVIIYILPAHIGLGLRFLRCEYW